MKATPKRIIGGKRHDSGIWLYSVSRRRLLHPWSPGGHDSVFIALGRLRIRIMVPGLHGERKAAPGHGD